MKLLTPILARATLAAAMLASPLLAADKGIVGRLGVGRIVGAVIGAFKGQVLLTAVIFDVYNKNEV